MIAVLSPSKTLNEKLQGIKTTDPVFKKDAESLVRILKKESVPELMSLMNISEKLAHSNFLRYKDFKKNPVYPAAWLFKGDVFRGLGIEDFNDEQIEYGQDHIFTLSGLYGFLRFKDGIHSYRLEMGTSLENPKGKNLYEFWGDRVYKRIIKETKTDVIINLASKEYSRVLNLKEAKVKVIEIEFLEKRKGTYTQIPLFSKKARGLMARFMAKSKAKNPEDLKKFNLEDYEYNDSLSSKENFVFTK